MISDAQLAQLNMPAIATQLRYHCGTRVCSITMSNRCAHHVLDKGKCESCLVKAPAQHASQSALVISELLCAGVHANTKRDTEQGETREMCSCWDTNNTPPHVNRESGVTLNFQQSSHLRAKQQICL